MPITDRSEETFTIEPPGGQEETFTIEPPAAGVETFTVERPEAPDSEHPFDLKEEGRRIEAEIEARKQPGGIGAQVRIGISRGGMDLGRAGNKALETLWRYHPVYRAQDAALKAITGRSPLAQFGQAAGEAGQLSQELEQLGEETQGPAIARKLGAGATSLAPSLAAGPLGFGAMVGTAGLQSFGGTLADAEDAYREQGFTAEQARRKGLLPAVASGLATALVTRGFGATGVEALARGGGRKAFGEAVKTVLREAGQEGAEEATDQAYQAVIQKLSYNPNLTTQEAVAQVLEAGALGVVLGGGVNVLVEASRRGPPTPDAQESVPTVENPQFLTEEDAPAEAVAAPVTDAAGEEETFTVEYAPMDTAGGDVVENWPEREDGTVEFPYSAAAVPQEPQTTSELVADGRKVVATEFPVADIEVDNVEVPQFKGLADPKTGEVKGEELKANRYERPSNPVVVWQRRNGRNLIVTGRHRFGLAKRLGEKTIPTTIVREADGFTRENAITLDAEFNIRDGNGSVEDYATYFENIPITEKEAGARGLLDRAKGRAAWALARLASDDLKALYKAGRIKEQRAVAIAQAAPGDAATQQLGIRYALAGKEPDFITNLMKAAQAESGSRGQTMDLFGNDSTAMQEMEERAERAAAIQREITERIRAVDNASKRPELARREGVDVSDPEGIQRRLATLRAELARWENWPLHPDLVAQVKQSATAPAAPARETLALAPAESVEEQKARLAKEDAAKAEREAKERMLTDAAAPLTGNTGDLGQGDLLGDVESTDLFSVPAPKKTSPQTITGSNVQAGTEMPVQPQPAPVGRAAGGVDRGDAVDGALTGAIEALTPKGGKVLEGVSGAPVWLARDAARGVLQVVRAAYRGGKALAAAIEDGVAWLRAQKIAGFDEGESRAWLEGSVSEEDALERVPTGRTDVRRLSKQIDAAPWVSERVKGLIQNRRYTVGNIAESSVIADEIVKAVGVQDAMLAFSQRDLLDPTVRARLGLAILDELSRIERAAVMELTPEGRARAEAAAKEFARFHDEVLEVESTESGQFTAALKGARGVLSPRSVAAIARQRLEKARDFVLASHEERIRKAKAAITGALASARQALRGDASVNRAAEGAVNAAVLGDAEVKGVVDAEAARAVAEELASGPGTAAGLSVQELAGVLTRHYASPQGTLADLLVKAGMEQAPAQVMARRLNSARRDAVAKSLREMRARIKRLNSKSSVKDAQERVPTADDAVDDLIRRKLKEQKLTLGRALKSGKLSAKTLGESIVADAGLVGPEADALRDAVNRRVGALVTAQAGKELEKLAQGVAATDLTGRKLAKVFKEAMELFRLGAFDEGQFNDLVVERLGLKRLAPEDSEALRALAERLEKTPPDQIRRRQEITHKIYAKLAQLKGVSVWDLGMAVWHSNALAGYGTQQTNIISNVQETATNVLTQTVRHPATFAAMVRAVTRGTARGGVDALHILHTGNVSGPRLQKLGDVGALDAVDTSKLSPAALARVAEVAVWAMRQPHRFLGAADAVFFNQASEVRQMLMARLLAKEKGLSGAALAKEITRLLALDAEMVRAASDQALAEGYVGWKERAMRRNEILDAKRGPEMVETGTQFGLRTTLNAPPYGVMGAAAKALEYGANWRPFKEGPRPLAVLQLVVPFRNIVANVVNSQLNFTPIGTARALMAGRWGLYGERVQMDNMMTREDIADLHTKAALGTAGIITLLSYALAHRDDEDFDITLNGPRNKGQREAWLAQGGASASIKVGGVSYPYRNSPAAAALAVVGGFMDAVKYRDVDEDTAYKQAAYGLGLAGKTLLQNSFLEGLGTLFGALDGDSEKSVRERMEKWAARTGTTFAVPNFFRQLDRAYDPTIYDAHGLTGAVLQQIPFARRINRPALNGLGDRMTRENMERWAVASKPDAAWRAAAELDLPLFPRQLAYEDEHGIRRALTPDQIYDVVQLSGPEIRKVLEDFARNQEGEVGRVTEDLIREGVPPEDAPREARARVRKAVDADVDAARNEAKRRVLNR